MDVELLKKKYERLGSIAKLGKEIGLSCSKTRLELLKHSIIVPDYSDIDLELLYKTYEETASIRECAKIFSTSSQRIREILTVNNKINKPIRYSCDENFFSRDTEKSFYWAGFIAADGCIKTKKNTKVLSLALSKNDQNHVEKFKNSLNANHPIGTYIVKNSKRGFNDGIKSEINICSKQMINDLLKFNITERKSLTLEFPQHIKEHPLISHFLRGYFDGDGSAYITKTDNKPTPQLYFNLRGTKNFLENYLDVLIKMTNCKNKSVRLNSGIYALEFGGNIICKSIYNYLYSNSTIYLERKYNKIFDHLNNLPLF